MLGCRCALPVSPLSTYVEKRASSSAILSLSLALAGDHCVLEKPYASSSSPLLSSRARTDFVVTFVQGGEEERKKGGTSVYIFRKCRCSARYRDSPRWTEPPTLRAKEILDQINEHGFMSYPRTETRSSRETSFHSSAYIFPLFFPLPPPIRQLRYSYFAPSPALDFVILESKL